MNSGSVINFKSVNLTRGENQILKNISFQLDFNQHLVIVGPNGAGKSSLVDIAAGYQFPSQGEVEILGKIMGKTDLAELKLSIGYVGPRIDLMMNSDEKVFDAVISAAYGIVGRWNESYSPYDQNRAAKVLSQLGMQNFSDRNFGTLSAGEKKKVEIARALMNDPELLILDEPAASLDLTSREDLLAKLNGLISSGFSPSILMVTHHLEEIPTNFTHAMLLNSGSIFLTGRIDDVLTEDNLSEVFQNKITLIKTEGRRFGYQKN